jgi:tetratricopeptide (TPR) repeat protein
MKMKIVASLLLICLLIILGIECCTPKQKDTKPTAKNEYTGNASCKNCHAAEHAQWEQSHHYMAMQPASDSVVFGDFNNATYTADGVTSRFFRRGDKFIINTEGEDGLNHDYEVKFIFGFTPLQQYLVEFPGGRMQVPRVSWDVKAKKWFHQYAGDAIPAGDWLHWTGNGQNWNTMCASCHSTNVNKGYDSETDSYHTTYNDINVSCESCHGPGKWHIDYVNGDDYKTGKKTPGSLLQLYRQAGQLAEVNTCGYCHARRVDITGAVLPGNELLDDFIPEIPTTDYFYADGQMRDEDYNYTSFVQSKMFHRGVQCSNCHNPHSGKLKLENSLVCGQCHEQKKYEAPSHTMHSAATQEVNCVSCHMPSKVYMGNDLRHDHSFRVPRPDLSAKFGTPNTCNSCHNNKTAQWAAEKITAHYGNPRPYHFSEDLVPGSQLNEQSEKHLQKLLGDTATPAIVRAATLRYFSQLRSANSLQVLRQHLTDSNAIVRYHAVRGLQSINAPDKTTWGLPLLQDVVRSVRIAAADLFLETPSAQMPQGVYDAFSKAKGELYHFIRFQTDFAVGNLQAGDYSRRQNDLLSAEKFYLRAIQKDSQLVGARVNLAATLNASGKNAEALQQLLSAGKIAPKNDHIQYSLGLLYAEMNEQNKALDALKKAVAINTTNVRAWYSLGLLHQQMGNAQAGESSLLNAFKANPFDGATLNALTIFYAQQGQKDKAMTFGKKLQQYHGTNPEYTPLLQQLGLQ